MKIKKKKMMHQIRNSKRQNFILSDAKGGDANEVGIVEEALDMNVNNILVVNINDAVHSVHDVFENVVDVA